MDYDALIAQPVQSLVVCPVIRVYNQGCVG
jgi:hypothetical protein